MKLEIASKEFDAKKTVNKSDGYIVFQHASKWDLAVGHKPGQTGKCPGQAKLESYLSKGQKFPGKHFLNPRSRRKPDKY